MRLTLKTINEELAKLGHKASVEKGDGYFYFSGHDAKNWLDRTVNVPTLSSLTLERWEGEFQRLKKLNQQVMAPGGVKEPASHKAKSSRPKPKRL